MSKKLDAPSSQRRLEEQRLIENALGAMSDEELVDLRSTAHRLKHLPFMRLVEALFAQTEERGRGEATPTGTETREHNFAGESSEGCQSDFLRTLFTQIERVLAVRRHGEGETTHQNESNE